MRSLACRIPAEHEHASGSPLFCGEGTSYDTTNCQQAASYYECGGTSVVSSQWPPGSASVDGLVPGHFRSPNATSDPHELVAERVTFPAS